MVVISDWFTFAFHWALPYSKFVIRVAENDFLADPVGVIERIREKYVGGGGAHIREWTYLLLIWEEIRTGNL